MCVCLAGCRLLAPLISGGMDGDINERLIKYNTDDEGDDGDDNEDGTDGSPFIMPVFIPFIIFLQFYFTQYSFLTFTISLSGYLFILTEP